MLSVWDAIKTRRSIRSYTPDEVPDEMIDQIMEAARLSPSAGNRQPWSFLVIKDKNVRKELRRICWNQPSIEEAPVVIVCLGDMDRYFDVSRAAERYAPYYGSEAPSPVQRKITFAMANCYIAVEHIVLMAQALGLGTCWIGGFDDAAEFQRLFDLPDNLVPIVVVPIGYPAGDIPPERPRRDIDDIMLKSETIDTGGST